MSIQAHELAIFPTSRTGWEEAFGQDGSPFENTSKIHTTDLRPQTSDSMEDVNMSGSGGGDNCDEEMDQNPDEAGWDPLHLLATAQDQVEGDHTLANLILLIQDPTFNLNSKNADFNSKFMQEVIALNIWTFIVL